MAPNFGLLHLTGQCKEAVELIAGIEVGTTPSEWAWLEYKRHQTELGRRIQEYSTALINTFLGNLRKKARLNSIGVLTIEIDYARF